MTASTINRFQQGSNTLLLLGRDLLECNPVWLFDAHASCPAVHPNGLRWDQ
jgi:hypothetical protein